VPNLDFITENGYTVLDPLPEFLTAKYKFLKVTPRKSMMYDRSDQVVAREIFVIKYGTEEIPNTQLPISNEISNEEI
jgi:hypothetical protein